MRAFPRSVAGRWWIAALAAISACFLSTSAARAGVVDPANAACRAAIAKGVSRLANTTMKSFDGCIQAALKGDSVDCSDHSTTDPKGKIPRAQFRLADAIGTKCDDTTHAVALSELERCGPPTGIAITGFADVAGCFNTMVPENIDALRTFMLDPDYTAVTPNAAKCIKAIAKNSTRLLKTIQKEKHKAIKASDGAGGDSNYVDPGDPSQKIEAATLKALDGVFLSCESLTLSEWEVVGTCDHDPFSSAICVLQHVFEVADGLSAAAYDLPGICPAIMDILFLDGAENGVVKRATDLDFGWRGSGHQIDSDGYFVQSVDVDCGAPTDNNCGTCSLSLNCEGGNCRCRNDNSILCDAPLMADAECSGNTCDVLFGPPLPMPAGSIPFCLVQRIESLEGSTSFIVGATAVDLGLRNLVFLGPSPADPCPTCVNGTCLGGERDGGACFPDATSDFGDVSYDCPPLSGANLTGAGIATAVDLSTAASSFTAQLPCDAPFGAVDCHCSACSGDTSIACDSDSVCTAAGAGVCSTTQAEHLGEDREPNGCSDQACTAVPGEPGEGECVADEEMWCNGLVKGNGDGVYACLSNSDCAVLPSLGTCTESRNRRCFLDPIAASGQGGPRTGIDDGVLSSAYCMPTSSTGLVNSVFGLPGPARMTLAAEFYAVCADGVTLWSPGGAVCQ